MPWDCFFLWDLRQDTGEQSEKRQGSLLTVWPSSFREDFDILPILYLHMWLFHCTTLVCQIRTLCSHQIRTGGRIFFVKDQEIFDWRHNLCIKWGSICMLIFSSYCSGLLVWQSNSGALWTKWKNFLSLKSWQSYLSRTI